MESNWSQWSVTASTWLPSGRFRSPPKLQVIGRIGEDQIDAGGRQRAHRGDAVARQDAAQRQIDARALSCVFTTLFARDFTFSVTLTGSILPAMSGTYPQA
jgi:hypothetical protein